MIACQVFLWLPRPWFPGIPLEGIPIEVGSTPVECVLVVHSWVLWCQEAITNLEDIGMSCGKGKHDYQISWNTGYARGTIRICTYIDSYMYVCHVVVHGSAVALLWQCHSAARDINMWKYMCMCDGYGLFMLLNCFQTVFKLVQRWTSLARG